jgi:3-hydroxybutyryl-CoA dehydratase
MADEYDKFLVGYKGSFTKEVTERDNLQFAEISGDYNPIHYRDDVARAAGFLGKISNGFVTESRVAAALVATFGSDTTLVLAVEKNTKFLKPVYMEDVITATVEVIGRFKSIRVLKIKADCCNQHGERVSTTKMLIRILQRNHPQRTNRGSAPR